MNNSFGWFQGLVESRWHAYICHGKHMININYTGQTAWTTAWPKFQSSSGLRVPLPRFVAVLWKSHHSQTKRCYDTIPKNGKVNWAWDLGILKWLLLWMKNPAESFISTLSVGSKLYGHSRTSFRTQQVASNGSKLGSFWKNHRVQQRATASGTGPGGTAASGAAGRPSSQVVVIDILWMRWERCSVTSATNHCNLTLTPDPPGPPGHCFCMFFPAQNSFSYSPSPLQYYLFSLKHFIIIYIHLSNSDERRLLTVELVLVVMLAVLLVELVDVAVSVLVLVRLELEDVTEVLELLDVVFELLPRCWMIWMVPIESGIS